MLRLLALKLSSSKRIDGLWIGTLLAEGEPDPALRRVEEALCLIKEYDRLRYDRLIRDLERVWVRPLPGLNGRFRHSLRICELDPTFILAETSLPEMIGSVIVHEAAHARLRGRGIGYEEKLRGRVEAVWYEGEFRDDNRNGHGVLAWPDGGRYEGDWRDGERNGHGAQTWADGRCYEGEWRDGKPLLSITTLDVIDP